MQLRPLVDDPEIGDDDAIIRVVPPGNLQGGEILSNAFEDYPADKAAGFGLGGPCMSVNLRSIWLESGADPSDLLKDFDAGSALAVISVGELRNAKSAGGDNLAHGVMRDPREGRPWHCVAFLKSGEKRTRAGKKAVQRLALLVPEAEAAE